MNFLFLFSLIFLVSCDEDSKSGTSGSGGGNDSSPLVTENMTGGCRIRLVTPGSGETVDVSGGKTYQFAWTTDGTNCETPYTLYVAGNPANPETGENIVSYQINAQEGRVSRTGGFINVSAEDMQAIKNELRSDDGTFHWLVKGFYGSHPASRRFKIQL